MNLIKLFREAITTHEVIGETAADKDKKKKSAVGGSYIENIEYVNTAAKAMKIASVYRAVNLLSSGVAVLTLQFKRKNRAKNYFMFDDSAEGKKINYLLSVQPNARQNAYTFMKYLVTEMLLVGNAFVLPKRNSRMQLEAYILLDPNSVSYDKISNVYIVNDVVNNISGTYEAHEIMHFKNFCIDGGYWGMSTIHYAATTLGIAATADNETLKRFGTGGRFKAILQNNQTTKGVGEYQDEQMQGMGEDLQEAMNRGDDIFVLKGDGQLTPISMSSADLQILDNRKFTVREIARFFNVPAAKLMDDTNSNYKSTEMSNIAFYSEGLQPIVTEIEREWNSKMLGESTYLDYKYKFDIHAIYALDLDSKAKWNQALLNTGQATVNDLRRAEDMEPVEKGDEVYLSVNLAPIGSEKLNGGSAGVTNVEA